MVDGTLAEEESYLGVCLAENQGTESLAFVNKTEELLLRIYSTSELILYKGSVVFAYMDYCPFSSQFSSLVFAAAQAFPDVAFLALKVVRVGQVSTSLRVSSFPALVYNGKQEPSPFFGNYSSLVEVLQFVSTVTGKGPITWNPPGVYRIPAAYGYDYIHYPFLQPEKPDPIYTDPFFVLSGIFLFAYLLSLLQRS